jgi:hypothetical protein
MMDTTAQPGYFVLADISGYSAYLAGVELDHAHGVLTDLLELMIDRFKPVLTISKLEGDAVFAYTPVSKLARGETLLELVEATYVAFRDRVEAIRRRTTCECKACRAIPTLDLKFILHHGAYMLQTVAGINELVGTDVNLVHRLLKNHVSEATGWRAYALFSDTCLECMCVQPTGMIRQAETYDLGEVQTSSFNLHPRYKELTEARRVVVAPEEAYLTLVHAYPVPPPIVWDWLNDPVKRASYTLTEGVVFAPVDRPVGRTGAGARNHCMHGKDVAMQETILDWRPFDYFTVEQSFMGFTMRLTYQLQPMPDGGTRLCLTIQGRSPAPGFLNRPVFMFALTKMFPMSKMVEKMAQRIDEELARESTLAPLPAAA